MVTKVAIKAGEELVMCPVCGIGTMDDMDPVYADIFVPGFEKVRAEMALCGACAVGVRNNAMIGCEVLPDRGSEIGGPQPPNGPTVDVWAEIGIVPR
jgi:C4-type Zn-finger protein